MAEQEQDQKTEAPTGKRLDEARERGQIPVSREISTWVVMVGILLVIGWMLPPMMKHLADSLRVYLETPDSFQVDENNIQALLYQVLGKTAMIVGLIFAMLGAAAIAGVMVQTGFFFALDLLVPDFSRLLPTRGFSKFFSAGSLVELGKSFAKLVFLGGMAFFILLPIGKETPSYTGMPLEQILDFLHRKTLHLIVVLVAGFTIIAIADLIFTRFQYIRNLRMTKAEIKDEHKQQEGDPMIKGRLRQMRIEKARKRMMAQVPKADVVITNPTHYAIALQYDGKKMSAPIVLAKGINLIAERIRTVALENQIPLVSNPPLARALHDTVEVDHPIPTPHYRAVAEVISYVYKLRKRRF